jgi:type 1 glutamine amidotransferase
MLPNIKQENFDPVVTVRKKGLGEKFYCSLFSFIFCGKFRFEW